MKKLLAIGMFLFTSVVCAKERKTVFIIVDGIPADVIERVSTPVLDEISERGFYSRASMGGIVGGYSQTPTISAVCYNSLITGTWVNKHNVWGNDISEPNYNYHSIFRVAENQKRDIKTAIFSSWEDNRTKLVGEGVPQTATPKIDYVLDGLELDKNKYPDEPHEYNVFKIDEEISKGAAECIKNDAPDLTWVYLWYLDCVGHGSGDGARFDEYTTKADVQVGRIWDAVKYREANFDEEWLVVVVTDHGRQIGGYSHGGQTERERTVWISSNLTPNNYLKECRPTTVDVYPTICRFMNFDMNFQNSCELDGTPLIGSVDIAEAVAKNEGDKIRLSWKNIGHSNTPVVIYVSTKNDYKSSKNEEWVKIAKTKSQNGEYLFDTKKYPSEFYKFVIKSKNNTLNVWSESTN